MINKREQFMWYMEKMLFLPYYWGGDDPIAGFDCSGSVNEGFKSIGMMTNTEDRTANQLRDWLKDKTVVHPIRGCLVFFKNDSGHVFHVGTCLNELQMIEFGGGGSDTIDLATAIKRNAYGRVRPFSTRTDIDCFIDPFI
jgi:cell wall-associated NlpC family hydrolase